MLKNNSAEETRDDIIKWIRNWFRNNGNEKTSAVIGISGGKDSTIIAALLVRALGKDRVFGVMMPNGIQADISDSRAVCKILDIPNCTVNINEAYNALIKEVANGLNRDDVANDTKFNLPPRLRMSTLYAIAQSLPYGGRVVNTCNRSEDYIGYSTKYGDAAGDFSPCMNLTVQEMLAIGDTLPEIPKELIHKTPSDGLCGQTDEDKIGFTYAALDRYILDGECDEETRAKIDKMHNANIHKLQNMPSFAPAYGPEYVVHFPVHASAKFNK